MKRVCFIRDILLARALESMDFSNEIVTTFYVSMIWDGLLWIVSHPF